jgi:diadenylate cyclase
VSVLFEELAFILQRIDLIGLVDLLLVTVIFFFIISLLRGTQAVVLLRGMVSLIIIMTLLTSVLPLPAFSWLLSNTLPAMVFAIPVIFAPEIRRAFERLGRAGNLFNLSVEPTQTEQIVNTIVGAGQRLADRHFGALIVIEREVRLDEYIETGVRLDASLTPELLMQIFYINTPLHDGAVILRQDRVIAAACVMPLSASGIVSRSPERQMGLRHRAALGISEVSDAVGVVISEETGAISVTHNGRMIRRLDQSRLRNILLAFYRPRRGRAMPDWLNRLLLRFSRRSGFKATGD